MVLAGDPSQSDVIVARGILSLEVFCRWDPSQSDVIVARGILSLPIVLQVPGQAPPTTIASCPRY